MKKMIRRLCVILCMVLVLTGTVSVMASDPEQVMVMARKLAAPRMKKAVNTPEGVKITWGKVRGAVKYRVFYKTADTGWKKLGDTTSTSYIWKNASPGVRYTFAVRCVSASGKKFTGPRSPRGVSLLVPAPTPTPSAPDISGVYFFITDGYGKTQITVTRRSGVYYADAYGRGGKMNVTGKRLYENNGRYSAYYSDTGTEDLFFELSGVTATGMQVTFPKIPYYNGTYTKELVSLAGTYTFTTAYNGDVVITVRKEGATYYADAYGRGGRMDARDLRLEEGNGKYTAYYEIGSDSVFFEFSNVTAESAEVRFPEIEEFCGTYRRS